VPEGDYADADYEEGEWVANAESGEMEWHAADGSVMTQDQWNAQAAGDAPIAGAEEPEAAGDTVPEAPTDAVPEAPTDAVPEAPSDAVPEAPVDTVPVEVPATQGDDNAAE
jgi:N utilization substance protein A